MLFSIFSSLLNAVFVGNIVTSGIGIEVTNSNDIRLKPTLIYTSIVAVLSIATFLLYYPIHQFVLVPLDATYLGLMIIAVFVIGLIELYRLLPYKWLPENKFLALNTVMLLSLFVSWGSIDFAEALLYTVGSVIGFIGLSLVFTTIFQRLRVSTMFKALKGLPIMLILLGLVALVMAGLGGVF